uniref:EF-hand domain-containing protein n=2 Tax=Magallana gigas TaxID=29159 RepID=A0A8W8NPZ8_MAGGI
MKYNPDNYRMTYKTVADTTLGCFLVVVRAQLSDDSRKRVLYKSLRLIGQCLIKAPKITLSFYLPEDTPTILCCIPGEINCLQDMQQCAFLYCWCLIFTVVGPTFSLYLPNMQKSRKNAIPSLQSNYKGALGVRWDKRGELETNLNSRFRHHSRKFLTKHRFITEMFRMFDLNGDGCVERDEFEYVLEFSDIWK